MSAGRPGPAQLFSLVELCVKAVRYSRAAGSGNKELMFLPRLSAIAHAPRGRGIDPHAATEACNKREREILRVGIHKPVA